MPQGKKGRSFNNKKKKRGGQSRQQQQQGNIRGDNTTRLVGNAPSYQDYHDREAQSDSHEKNYPTVYTRYKQATERFFAYMQHNAPEHLLPETQQGKLSVNSLVSIADWMEETGFVIQKERLKDLKLAIRIRSRVAKSVFGGGDAGHEHLLTVLTYCWTVLVNLDRTTSERPVDTTMVVEEESKDQDRFISENAFAVLQDDMEDVDDNKNEEFLPSAGRVPRPTPEEEPMSLQDLIDSDDRNDVILFLLTMDGLMDFVAKQYQRLSKSFALHRSQGDHDSALAKDLIEAAVATNMAIQQLQQLEMEFEVHHPEITTPYRLLAVFALPEFTQRITEIVRDHAQKPVHENDVIAFLGDCIECGFRAPHDKHNKKTTGVVSDFCSLFEVDSQGEQRLDILMKGLSNMILLEVPMYTEQQQNRHIMTSIQNEHGISYPSHSWIPSSMSFIGGDRAIHHTLRLLQIFAPEIERTSPTRPMIAQNGLFGPSPWTERRTHKIHNDMDDLFMVNILPQWVMLCRFGILGKCSLPRLNEIAPLWVSIKNYVDAPEKSIRWSTVFAFHAMLTAVFETKEILNDIMGISQEVYENYFEELEWGSRLNANENDAATSKVYRHNLELVQFLKNFGLPAYGNLAMFNPLCSGTYFSYLTFFANLEAGCTLIDDRAQLRIVLHLFNGLLANNIIKEGDIPNLDRFHKAFCKSKAIWEGPVPNKGGLVERFWVAYGCSRKDAKRFSDEARNIFTSSSHTTPSNVFSKTANRRKISHLEPAEIAKCYRRICNRDFHDVVDNYHTPEERTDIHGTVPDMYNFSVRVYDTLDAIDYEHQLLAHNFVNWGVLMEFFVSGLNKFMQWDKVLKSPSLWQDPPSDSEMRFGRVWMFAQYLLGSLDFASDPMDFKLLEIPQGRMSAQFMGEFFTQVASRHIAWFQSIQEEGRKRALDVALPPHLGLAKALLNKADSEEMRRAVLKMLPEETRRFILKN